jgi:hypothetical protein
MVSDVPDQLSCPFSGGWGVNSRPVAFPDAGMAHPAVTDESERETAKAPNKSVGTFQKHAQFKNMVYPLLSSGPHSRLQQRWGLWSGQGLAPAAHRYRASRATTPDYRDRVLSDRP